MTNALSRLPSPQLSDLARSHVVTCDKQKQEQKEGNSMLAHILSFFLRKIHPASLSIMQEHNFEHNARILGLTLKKHNAQIFEHNLSNPNKQRLDLKINF